MKNKIFRIAVLLFFMSVSATFATPDNDNENECGEIDNYDFLYGGSDADYNYDFVAIDNVLDEAFSHIGARYRSGHSGPNAFDCSGFTSYVYGKLNIQLNRSSRDQYNQGEAVGKGDLQSGDLVFFTSPRSGRSIGHVGIVVDVNHINGSFNFIHASIKGVKVSNSNDAYYARRYVGARRVM